MNRNIWIIAFVVPFLLVDGLTAWFIYDQLVQLNNWAVMYGTKPTEIDVPRSVLMALLMSSPYGCGAGLLSLVVVFVYRKLTKR